MADFPIRDVDVKSLELWIRDHDGLAHVRARKVGETITLESGPARGAMKHARLRRVSAQLWTIEMPVRGKWYATGVRARKGVILEQLLKTASWMLSDDQNPPLVKP